MMHKKMVSNMISKFDITLFDINWRCTYIEWLQVDIPLGPNTTS